MNDHGNFTSSCALADNLTYGSSPGDATVSIKEDPSLLEASMYEVPFSAAQSINGSTGHDHEYELTGSFYAVPNMFEYATLGPNGAMVIQFGSIYMAVIKSTVVIDCKECFQTHMKCDSLGEVIESLCLIIIVLRKLCGFMCMTLLDLSPGSELRIPLLSIG